MSSTIFIFEYNVQNTDSYFPPLLLLSLHWGSDISSRHHTEAGWIDRDLTKILLLHLQDTMCPYFPTRKPDDTSKEQKLTAWWRKGHRQQYIISDREVTAKSRTHFDFQLISTLLKAGHMETIFLYFHVAVFMLKRVRGPCLI